MAATLCAGPRGAGAVRSCNGKAGGVSHHRGLLNAAAILSFYIKDDMKNV